MMVTIIVLLIFLGINGCNSDNNDVLVTNDDCLEVANLDACSINSNLQYDYCVKDINVASCTYGKKIGPGYFANQVTLHYFGHQD